jgi:hypothetical protein
MIGDIKGPQRRLSGDFAGHLGMQGYPSGVWRGAGAGDPDIGSRSRLSMLTWHLGNLLSRPDDLGPPPSSPRLDNP